jgi:pimeloyl-ACP methyl ester carboxylesterase
MRVMDRQCARCRGAGHWPMLDQPDALNQLLIGFLKRRY